MRIFAVLNGCHVDSLWLKMEDALNRAKQISSIEEDIQVEDWPVNEVKTRFNNFVVWGD